MGRAGEGKNGIPLQEAPLGVSEILQVLAHCCSPAGQTSVPERAQCFQDANCVWGLLQGFLSLCGIFHNREQSHL